MRYESKKSLLDSITSEHDLLVGALRRVPETRYREAGVWGDGWNLRDLVAHLAEWQEMFLRWYGDGLDGRTPQMPAPGYKWNETPKLNCAIRAKHKSRAMPAVLKDFESGYARIVALVEQLPPGDLLSPGRFAWTGKYPLTTYLGPNTASHYRFASKVIKRWERTRSTP